jgi:ElaB/YqjD/DUF883 family membrane-anchored ribosome-binding protein
MPAETAPFPTSSSAAATSSSSTAATPRETPAELHDAMPDAAWSGDGADGNRAASADDLIGRIAQSAHDTIDRLAEVVAPRVNRLQERVSGAGDSLQVRADHAREVTDEWAESLRCTVRESPLAAVGVALAVGLLVARLTR